MKTFKWMTMAVVSWMASVGWSSEYTVNEEAKADFHQQLNGFTYMDFGVVPLADEYLFSFNVGGGQWVDGGNYGYGLNIQYMPQSRSMNNPASQVTLDYNSLSVFGKWIPMNTGFVEVSLHHGLGVGLLKVITTSTGSEGVEANQREEGFGFGDLGLSLDFPLSNSFEITTQTSLRQAFALEEDLIISNSDLSGVSAWLGFRWYPNAVSEVK